MNLKAKFVIGLFSLALIVGLLPALASAVENTQSGDVSKEQDSTVVVGSGEEIGGNVVVEPMVVQDGEKLAGESLSQQIMVPFDDGSSQKSTYLTLKVIGLDGNVETIAYFTLAELRELAADPDGDPLVFQYYKNDLWTVLCSRDYVTFDALFEAAEVEVDPYNDILTVDGYPKWTGASLSTIASGKFYPKATSIIKSGSKSGSYFSPAGIALTYADGTAVAGLADPALALAIAENKTPSDTSCPRIMMGVYDVNNWGGFVSASKANTLVLTRATENSGGDNPGEGGSMD